LTTTARTLASGPLEPCPQAQKTNPDTSTKINAILFIILLL
jgi:hypothetical protein